MKILPLLLLLISNLSYGQFKKLKLRSPAEGYSKQQLMIEKGNHKCIHIKKETFSSIIKKYPFNESSKIILVSFRGSRLPRENDSICYSKLLETQVLTLTQIDSLTNIMYNIGYGGTVLIEKEDNCYDPRNAILFVNSSDKIFEYIEICFECEQIVTSSQRINFGDSCNEKFDLIKKQFRNAGIVFGISKTE